MKFKDILAARSAGFRWFAVKNKDGSVYKADVDYSQGTKVMMTRADTQARGFVPLTRIIDTWENYERVGNRAGLSTTNLGKDVNVQLQTLGEKVRGLTVRGDVESAAALMEIATSLNDILENL